MGQRGKVFLALNWSFPNQGTAAVEAAAPKASWNQLDGKGTGVTGPSLNAA